MCGIWGTIQGARRYAAGTSGRNTDFSKFAYAASITGTLRGSDSTGIALVGKTGGDAVIYKAPVPGGVFSTLKEAIEMFDLAAESSVMIGHNRAATLGKVDENSAHPFQHGDITMVHNGTVHGFRRDLADLIAAYDPVNDSDAIAYALDVAGWKEVLPRLTGAYALAWWDKHEGKLFLARNDERPMHIAFAEYANEMYYASEGGMLSWLLEREKRISKDTDIYSIQPGQVYSFSPTEDGRLEDTFTKEGFTIAKKSQPWWGWGHGQAGRQTTTTHMTPSSGGTPTRTSTTSSEKLMEAIGVTRGEIFGFLPETINYNKENSKHGAVTGELVRLTTRGEPTTTKGVIYGIDSITWQQWKSAGWMEVKIAGALKDKSALVCTFHGYGEPTSLTQEESKEDSKSAKEERVYHDGNGEVITEEEFLALAHGGCVSCRAPILAQDADSVEYVGVNKNFLICGLCADQDWHKG